ncbi:alpha/beta hydrolase [Thiomicrorhabdus sediminis]|uniref:Alpha/beta fold hydrolase n=1 Tax=Thiomicrorhabdus sediminis TaxID=2580412 RepID=A0A4P9K6B6_9GAMM|nr:alpha/beta hydrolase family protein [Thiomicrorhabdus sediminis]QCU90614.1 alpha/beta fold hydrolase [Thiomicrorhabdus sediminis]
MSISRARNILFAFALLSIGMNSAWCKTVTQPIEVLGVPADAEYIKGNTDKPAVMIVHGFLTTNKFHTITSISKALSDEGYTVLAPTLTLGIASRQSPLKCNSIHSHTLENDVAEIADWRQWLKDQGHEEVVVVGHSSGSPLLLEYLTRNSQANIKAAIFTSLFFLNAKELGSIETEIEHAQQQLAANSNKPHKYSFLFCRNNYFATPESFLSYMKLTRKYVFDLLAQLNIPHYTVMGGADKRHMQVGGDWYQQLNDSETKLVVIDGANHFFSSEYEFDLQDEMIKILNQVSQH